MAIPLIGGARPLTAALFRALGLGDANDFVTGNDTLEYSTSIGSWTTPGTGTLARNTGYPVTGNNWIGAGAGLVGSMEWVPGAANEYVELPISGTFKAGKRYWATLIVEEPAGGFRTMSLGLIGTDASVHASGNGTINLGGQITRALTISWVPSADRTGVKLRYGLDISGSSVYFGYCRVYQASEPRIPYDGNPGSIRLPLVAHDNWEQVTNLGLWGYGITFSDSGWVRYENATGTAGTDAGSANNPDIFLYAEDDGSGIGDLASGGINVEVGPDYVGYYMSEVDADTVQFYADYSGGYTLQLRHRGGKGWSASDDGVTNARIDSFFQWERTVAGVLTTGTNKAAHFQSPQKAIIDEVRCHVGTAPTGQAILVDVNDDGVTIFTTQGNRPSIAISGTDDTSGTPDGGTAVAKDSVITVDIDQIGSGTAGSDLTVFIRGRYIW